MSVVLIYGKKVVEGTLEGAKAAAERAKLLTVFMPLNISKTAHYSTYFVNQEVFQGY